MSLESKIKDLLEGKKLPGVSNDEASQEGAVSDESVDKGAQAASDNAKAETGKSKKLDNGTMDTSDPAGGGQDGQTKTDNAKIDAGKSKKLGNSVKEHMDALSFGEDLSEDFMVKAATIMEAAIAEGVEQELNRLDEEYAQRLDEAVDAVRDELVENIDGYMTEAINTWLEANELALERGIKGEIIENFIDGLKNLFTEHYIDVPEEKLDILDEQASEIEELTAALDESVSTMANMEQEIVTLKRANIVENVGSTLTATEKDKFVGLCEGLTFESAETFEQKVKTIKESHFPKTKKATVIAESDTPVQSVELNNTMAAYVNVLSGPLSFKR